MRRLALPGAVVLALLAVFLIAWGTQPGPARVAIQGDQGAAVTSITRSCPPAAPGTAAGRITMVALPPGAAAARQRPLGPPPAGRRRDVQRGTSPRPPPAAAPSGKPSGGKAAPGGPASPTSETSTPAGAKTKCRGRPRCPLSARWRR